MVGWELRVDRLGIQKHGAQMRTYGSYQVYVGEEAIAELSGFVCEPKGPSDNINRGGTRIASGAYPLWTQFGKYVSKGYVSGTVADEEPMPGVALKQTGKRSAILIHPAHSPNLFLSSIGCLNLTGPLKSGQPMEYFDSRARVIALLKSLKDHFPAAFRNEVQTRIGDASITIRGDPDSILADPTPFSLDLKVSQPIALPISPKAAEQCTHWLMTNFGAQLRAAVVQRPYNVEHLCAIVCQETAFKWVPWIKRLSVKTIVERAVFDASGDFPGTSRNAFPQNTPAFRNRYGDMLTDMLIEEANKTRRLQAGYGDKDWVYKGYGLFQYDLQHISKSRDFFEQRRWYSFSDCLEKCVTELDEKFRAVGGDLWEAIRAYNGSGPNARDYREKVREFTRICKPVVLSYP